MSIFNEDCPMCQDPTKSMSWVRLIMANQRTALECAKYFNMDPKLVNEHVYKHITVEDATMDPNNPDYMKNKLFKFLNILEVFFDDMTITGKPDRNDIDLIMRLISSMQSTLKIVGELDGKLNKADPKLQIINVQNDMRALTNVIMMDLCDHCQPIAMKAVEKMQITAPKSSTKKLR